MMMDFTMGFDSHSLAEIAQFYSFSVFLSEEMATAMKEAGDLVAAAAIANTWTVFAHPTGELASSIAPVLDSPFEVQIGADVPYARRREFGFSGMTASLGRFFPYDPAKPYMAPALAANEQAVMTLVEEAAIRTWARIGGV